VRTRQNIFWLLAILALCAALFRPSPPKPAAVQPTHAPPPEPIASTSPAVKLPPEAVCPMCHSSAQVQPIYNLLWSCVVGPLDYHRKERRLALSKGMHVDHRSFMGNARNAAWFCQSCKCHFQWTEVLVESPAPPAELDPSQDCSNCDSDTRWAKMELQNTRTLKEMEERSAAHDRRLEAARRNDENFKKIH
jgi:hypothetical protein